MHYRFQHALQISTCTEIFKMLFQDVFNTFQTWKFTYDMNHVENCVENHVKYFKVCWKPCWKFQGLGRTAEKSMMWPWHDLLKTYFTELIQLKYKLILWIKTMGCCGLACVVWLKSCEFLKRKSVLIVYNSSMMCLLQKILNLTYMWTFFIFYATEWTCLVFYYLWEAKSIWKKSEPLKQLFDALETNSLSLMTVLKYFS